VGAQVHGGELLRLEAGEKCLDRLQATVNVDGGLGKLLLVARDVDRGDLTEEGSGSKPAGEFA